MVTPLGEAFGMPFSDLIDNHGFGISMALHKLQTQANIAAPVRDRMWAIWRKQHRKAFPGKKATKPLDVTI